MQRDGELILLMFSFYKSCMQMNIILQLLCVPSFAAKYLTISCVIRNSYISVTACNVPILYRHAAHYLPKMVVEVVTSLTFVRDAAGSSRGRDTDEPGVLRCLPQFVRANFAIVP